MSGGCELGAVTCISGCMQNASKVWLSMDLSNVFRLMHVHVDIVES